MSEASMLCPECRQPMVDVSRALGWEKDRDRDEWEEERETGLGDDFSKADEGEMERVWECPNCGHREYEP